MYLLLEHEPQVHYQQRRPMDWTTWNEARLRYLLKAGQGIYADCSESVTALCRWAGLSDPSGFHYNGSGNSGTIWQHLPHYSDPSRAQVGALVTFGPAGADHVAMVYRPGVNPTLWSHGAERGPRTFPYSVERDFHRRPATFCSIAAL
jgi:hypothetical protein